MFKPELWQSHDEYRTIISTIGRRLSRNNPKYSFNEYDAERQKLLNLNLDPLLDYIPGFYSQSGRPAKHQAQILRSLILFVLLFNKTKARTSLTLWVREVLPNSISLTVLTGCSCPDDLPPPRLLLRLYKPLLDRPERTVFPHGASSGRQKRQKTKKTDWRRWKTGGAG